MSPELIAAHGAVSEPVAVALADGIRARTGATSSLGVTGIAGPGGGSPEKPVGTVAIALTGSGMPPARATVLVFRRPAAGEVPGVAGRARYGAEGVASPVGL